MTSSLLRTNLALNEIWDPVRKGVRIRHRARRREMAERGCEVLGSKGGKIQVGLGAREGRPRAPGEQGKEESKILGE